MSTPEPETDRSLWQRHIQRNVATMTPEEHLERLRYDIVDKLTDYRDSVTGGQSAAEGEAEEQEAVGV